MKRRKKINILIAFMAITCAIDAQISSQWRGMNRDGKYPDRELLSEWPVDGPQKIWTIPGIGIGHSSAVVKDDVIYITGIKETVGVITALNLEGKVLWENTYGSEWEKNFEGTRTTPTIDGDFIYLVSGIGEAYCLSTKKGETIWKVDLFKTFDGENLTWGITESPVVYKDRVIFMPGGKNTMMVALNKADGSTAWKTPAVKGEGEEGYKSAYCSPQIFEHHGKTIIASHTEKNIVGVDAENGNLLFTHFWPNQWSVHANTPLYKKDMLFCASGYGKGSIMLRIAKDGKSVSTEWENPSFDPRMTGFVEIDGYIYGSGEKKNGWQCIEWKTGKQVYSSKDIQIGSVITADNKLYCFSEKGEVALVNPTTEKFDIVSQFQLSDDTKQNWPHPVIYNGILLLRLKDTLYAFNIKK